VARQLGEAGIRVEVNVRHGAEWTRLVESGRSSFYLYGWACETRDAGDALDALIHSPTPDGLGLNNFQGISDPELDRLIDAVHTAPGPTLARELYARALTRVAELHLVVPLEIQPETMAVSRDLAWEPPLNFGLRRLETARPVPEP
jgi:ABC-type oligopeptide transport system substrate-binding subunit